LIISDIDECSEENFTCHSNATCINTQGSYKCVCMVWYGMVWYGMVWYGMVWYGMVWHGIEWYGMVLNGMVLNGMVWY
jgi:hypothetical protein